MEQLIVEIRENKILTNQPVNSKGAVSFKNCCNSPYLSKMTPHTKDTPSLTVKDIITALEKEKNQEISLSFPQNQGVDWTEN